jgi:hypothetical protein
MLVHSTDGSIVERIVIDLYYNLMSEYTEVNKPNNNFFHSLLFNEYARHVF